MSKLEKIQSKLTDILTNVANVHKINKYELIVNTKPLLTEGFLSDFYTGVVINKDNGQVISVAIKLIPEKGGIFQDYVILYKNEDSVYSKILPALDKFQDEKEVKNRFKNIPKYFCGSTEPENEFIAMQNMQDLGYSLLDKKTCFSENHLNLIFETLAKFHALSFAFKDQYSSKYNEMLQNLADIFASIKEKDAIVESIEKNVLSAFLAVGNQKDIITKLNNIGDIKSFIINGVNYKGQYECIVHGDSWSNNMLFKYKDSGELDDMKLIDFQMTKEGSPVHDLIFFFYSGASEKDLDNLDMYLEKYYNSFSNFAKELGSDPDKLYPWEVLKSEWKEKAVVGAFLSIDMLVPKLMDNNDLNELRKKEGTKEEMFKIWDEEMDKVRRNDVFKNRTSSIILHLVKFGFL